MLLEPDVGVNVGVKCSTASEFYWMPYLYCERYITGLDAKSDEESFGL